MPEVFVSLSIFIASLVLVIKGTGLFSNAVIEVAQIIRIPPIIIGATLVSLVTTLPETTVAIVSSLSGANEIALGNVLGTPPVNLGLLLGLTLLLDNRSSLKKEEKQPLLLRMVILLIIITTLTIITLSKNLSSSSGVLLISIAVIYLAFSLFQNRRRPNLVETTLEHLPPIRSQRFARLLKVPASLIAGGAMLLLGSRFLVDSGVGMANLLGVPQVIIGLTLVAIGTSVPELAIVVNSYLKKRETISLGNTTGASILTLTLALGLAALFRPIAIPESVLKFDLPALFVFAAVPLLLFIKSLSPKLVGGLLLAGYIIYLMFVTLGQRASS